MPPRHLLVACAVASTATALSAQNHFYSPIGHGPVPAATATGYPWGYSSMPAFRYQQVHDDVTGPRLLLGLAVRRVATGAAYVGLSPTLSLDISSAAVTSQTSTSTYATNHGANQTTILASRVVNFPPVPAPTNGLAAPFTYLLTFDRPWLHQGPNGVCWEVLMTANPYTGSLLSFDLAQNAVARSVGYGTGCAGMRLAGSYTAPNLALAASGLQANAPAFLLAGIENSRFAGQPLPLDLTFLGAAGCSLYVEPALVVSQAANANGTTAFLLDLPAIHPFLAASFQVAGPNATMPLGLAFSNGWFATPSLPATFMRNWNSNVTSTTGNLQLVYALATDFLQP